MPNAGSVRERTALVWGMSVRYWVAGAGEPVVLIHGLSGSSRWWVRISRHWRTIFVSMWWICAGFGGAHRPRGSHRPFRVVGVAVLVDGVGRHCECLARRPLHGRQHRPRTRGTLAGGGAATRAGCSGWRALSHDRAWLCASVARGVPHAHPRFAPIWYATPACWADDPSARGGGLIVRDIRTHAQAVRAPTLLIGVGVMRSYLLPLARSWPR